MDVVRSAHVFGVLLAQRSTVIENLGDAMEFRTVSSFQLFVFQQLENFVVGDDLIPLLLPIVYLTTQFEEGWVREAISVLLGNNLEDGATVTKALIGRKGQIRAANQRGWIKRSHRSARSVSLGGQETEGTNSRVVSDGVVYLAVHGDRYDLSIRQFDAIEAKATCM